MALVGDRDASGGVQTAVAAFVEVDVDTEIGTVGLGELTVALICADAGSQGTRLATDAGIASAIAAALIDESARPTDYGGERGDAFFDLRVAKVMDIPDSSGRYYPAGSGAVPTLADIAAITAGATVGAIANAIRNATGIDPVTLPMSFDRLRLLGIGASGPSR